MTAPNRNTLWAATLVEELAASGVRTAALAPGSRSTPLTVAFHDSEIQTYSHLDERSAAFFALGRARRTGRPTPVVCTSGTAAANFHPAVLEASESRVPLLLLTADRPPELRDSGANQTTDQEKLYGGAVRWYKTLPEPDPTPRTLRSLRVTGSRAVAETTRPPAGPVHLNVPFRKPLEPTPVEGDVPADLPARDRLAAEGRSGPFVETTRGQLSVADADSNRLCDRLESADRGLIVCGPADAPVPSRDALIAFADATGFPVLADPLSGHRFGHEEGVVCGGYDSYLDAPDVVPDPGVVVRFGASPTSKVLRKYLAGVDAYQILVDPAGGWREAEFTATHLVEANPTAFVDAVSERIGKRAGDGPHDVERTGRTEYADQFATIEQRYWDAVRRETDDHLFEGSIAATVAQACPDPSTLFVSNSMPVRDLDRFARPRSADITTLGNRGVSGIDGITSTALGAGSATDEPLVALTGDIAFYHDMNGLLAVRRCGVDVTLVLVNNDGGGIFHALPIESFDPPFTEQFRTPHGLDFAPAGELYDVPFQRVETLSGLESAVTESASEDGSRIIAVEPDAEQSHRTREALHERICDQLID